MKDKHTHIHKLQLAMNDQIIFSKNVFFFFFCHFLKQRPKRMCNFEIVLFCVLKQKTFLNSLLTAGFEPASSLCARALPFELRVSISECMC